MYGCAPFGGYKCAPSVGSNVNKCEIKAVFGVFAIFRRVRRIILVKNSVCAEIDTFGRLHKGFDRIFGGVLYRFMRSGKLITRLKI